PHHAKKKSHLLWHALTLHFAETTHAPSAS
ncbi:MAG: hypothetical protein ACI9C3_002798, partial [Yoonia sp.]